MVSGARPFDRQRVSYLVSDAYQDHLRARQEAAMRDFYAREHHIYDTFLAMSDRRLRQLEAEARDKIADLESKDARISERLAWLMAEAEDMLKG